MANLGKVVITPKGTWTGPSNYVKLDCVYYNGSTWLALQSSTGITPAEGAYWTLLAQGFNAASFNDLTDKPTTVSGYGITNAYTKTEVNNQIGDRSLLPTPNTDLVSAVNEVNVNVGDKTLLSTNNKTNLVGAINENKGNIDKKAQKRKFILLSDSYGESPDASNSWLAYVKSYARIPDAYTGYLSGAGFGSPIKILTALQNLSSTITDKSDITEIIVGCGYNDIDYVSDINAGIIAFVSYVAANYPNAAIKLAVISLTKDGTKLSGLMSGVVPAYKTSGQITDKINYIENSHYMFHRYDFLVSDGIHPNNFGSAEIARGISGYIQTGSVMYSNTASHTSTIVASGINPSTNLTIVETDLGETINAIVLGGAIINITPQTFTDYAEIGVITPAIFINGYPGVYCSLDFVANIYNGSVWKSAPASIVFRSGKAYIMITTTDTVSSIQIPLINKTMNKLYC